MDSRFSWLRTLELNGGEAAYLERDLDRIAIVAMQSTWLEEYCCANCIAYKHIMSEILNPNIKIEVTLKCLLNIVFPEKILPSTRPVHSQLVLRIINADAKIAWSSDWSFIATYRLWGNARGAWEYTASRYLVPGSFNVHCGQRSKSQTMWWRGRV